MRVFPASGVCRGDGLCGRSRWVGTMDYKHKNILVMGLGIHGGGQGVARFMARNALTCG